MILTSFVVLFLAEWGDLTQLLTASLEREVPRAGLGVHRRVARVSSRSRGLAVTGGKAMLRLIPLQWVRRIAALAFGIVAVVTGLEAAGVM